MKLLRNIAAILAFLQVALLTLPLHAQLPDSLTPHLRWVRTAFSHARAISLDGSKVLFVSNAEFGIWERQAHDIDRVFPIGRFNVIDAAFAPGDSEIFVLMTNHSLSISLSGGNPHLVFQMESSVGVELYEYSIATGERSLVGGFVSEAPDFNFSEDGSKLFAYSNHFLKVVDTRTGRVVDSCGTAVEQHNSYRGLEEFRPNPIKGVYPSTDGKYYVLYSGNDSLLVFSQSPLKELYTISPHRRYSQISSIWISPRNHLKVVAMDSIRTWDLDSERYTQAFPYTQDDHLTWISENSLVGIRLYRAEGFHRPMLIDYGDPYMSNEVMPDDSLYLIDLKHGSSKYLGSIAGLSDLMVRTPHWMVFSKQGAASELLDLRTLRRDPMPGVEFYACSLQALEHDTKVTAYSSDRGGLILDTKTGRSVYQSTGYKLSSTNTSPDGRFEWGASGRREYALRDLKSGKIVRRFAESEMPSYAKFSQNSRWLAGIEYGQSKSTAIALVNLHSPDREIKFNVSPSALWFIFSHDSKSLYSYGSDDGLVVKWDINSARPVDSLYADNYPIRYLLTSNDDKWLIAFSDIRLLKIWNLQDTTLRSILLISGYPRSVAFTPNGRYLVVVTDRCSKLVDLTDDKVVGDIPGLDSEKQIQEVKFTSNGWFAVGWGGSIWAYDISKAWLRPTLDPIRPKRSFLPLRFFVPPEARPALQNGSPYKPPRTDASLELLDSNHALIAKLLDNTTLGTNWWHLWDWDATGRRKGRFYMRTTIGGVVEEKQLELR
jgi:DNA-binding beta-propeller fold protein YncE